jgi:hypothetical protein
MIFQMVKNQCQAGAKNKFGGCFLNGCTGKANIDRRGKRFKVLERDYQARMRQGCPERLNFLPTASIFSWRAVWI